jgi:hypothetical protein
MSIKDIKMFDSKAIQNVPKLGIWLDNKPSGNPGYMPCTQKEETQNTTSKH